MVLTPTDQETLSLALALENGLKQGAESQALALANGNLDLYIDSILRDLSGDNGMLSALTPLAIDKLSVAQFWSLVYLGVQNELNRSPGVLSFTLFSAINTLVEKRPEHKEVCIDVPLSPVDITNIVFNTEFDLPLSLMALENILAFIAKTQAEQNAMPANSADSDVPMVAAPADITPVNN